MYNKRITIAVPEKLIEQANQLALLIWDCEGDANTFWRFNFKKSWRKYSVASSSCTEWIITMLMSGNIVIEWINNGEENTGIKNKYEADIDQAIKAFQAIGAWEILVSINDSPELAINELRLEKLEDINQAKDI